MSSTDTLSAPQLAQLKCLVTKRRFRLLGVLLRHLHTTSFMSSILWFPCSEQDKHVTVKYNTHELPLPLTHWCPSPPADILLLRDLGHHPGRKHCLPSGQDFINVEFPRRTDIYKIYKLKSPLLQVLLLCSTLLKGERRDAEHGQKYRLMFIGFISCWGPRPDWQNARTEV